MKKDIRNLLAPILTLLVYVLIVAILFVTLKFTNQIDESFWVTTLIGTVLMIFTTVLWHPKGVEKGREDEKFTTIEKSYNRKANYIIDKQLQKKGTEFCVMKNEKFKEELLKQKLASRCLSADTFETFIDYKRNKLNEKDKANFEKELATYSKKQLKLLNSLIEKEITFKELKLEDLIKVSEKVKSPKPTSQERIYKVVTWSVKIGWSLLCFTIFSFIVISPNTGGWLSKFVQLMIWTLTIGSNIFMSILNGYNSIVVYRKNDLLELDTLCAEFFEWAHIDINEKEEQA